MTNFIVALIFLTLAFAGVVVRKTYYQFPLKELKRRAVRHDQEAARLYTAVAYTRSLRALLWLYIGLTSAISIVLLSRNLPIWVSLLLVGPLLWVAFSFVPATRVTNLGTKLTLLVTPAIVWLLNYLHPFLSNKTEKVESRYKKHSHTRLFERDDLIDLIEKQKKQQDSRFTTEELDIAKRALLFGDKRVGDVFIPQKETKAVLEGDHVGPVLIDEIYKSQQKYVLVQDGKKGPFVGVLESDALGIHSEGLVRNLMRPCVYYLHEDDTLSDALKAFFKTNFPVFIVVNSHEEFVGIVTVEGVLQQLMGHIPGDDFSEYSDISAVASRYDRKDLLVHDFPDDSKADE